MTETQVLRFKLMAGVYAVNAAVGGSTNPLAWNVYGKAMALVVLIFMIRFQYDMWVLENHRDDQD